MGESVHRLTDAELQRAISEHAAGDPLAAADLLRLQEFVDRAGGIEAARELLEMLAEILPEGDLSEIDPAAIAEALDLDDLEGADDDADGGDLDQIAA